MADNISIPTETVARTDVATAGDRKQNEAENVLTTIFKDPIKKELSYRIKKNHPRDLIIGNPSESVVTRWRYGNLLSF